MSTERKARTRQFGENVLVKLPLGAVEAIAKAASKRGMRSRLDYIRAAIAAQLVRDGAQPDTSTADWVRKPAVRQR